MNTEDNSYGLIANAKAEAMSKASKELVELYKANTKIAEYVDNINIDYRTIIRVVNSNQRNPIVGYAEMNDNIVSVKIPYSKYGIKEILYERTGETINGTRYVASASGQYCVFIIVDNAGNTLTCTAGYLENPPDFTGFRVDSTFVVTYDDSGKEVASQPISEILQDGYELSDSNTLVKGNINLSKVNETNGKWYNYSQQKWANVVVRNYANEAYFVWIPRYAYKLNSDQTSEIVFINNNNQEPRTGEVVDLTQYKIPEAFSWIDADGNIVPLSGFWASKYHLSGTISSSVSISTYGGMNKIRVNSLGSSISGARYELSLLKGEEVLYHSDDFKIFPYEFSENTRLKLEGGTDYKIKVKVYDSNNYYRTEGETGLITVYDPVVDIEGIPEKPDLTGFNPEHTYYVVYDENGNENSTIPITEDPPANWYNYAEQKWANIVTRNYASEAYFVWIPRYEYHLYDNDVLKATEQFSDVHFIPVTQVTPTRVDTKIPEAFSWIDAEGNTVPLAGFWASKYHLSNTTARVSISTYGGVNKIRLNSVSSGISGVRYDVYLMKDDEVVYYKEDLKTYPYEFGEKNGEKLEGGTYSIKVIAYDSNGIERDQNIWTGITVYEPVINLEDKPEKPDLTGFNANITYYVTYDEEGNEDTSIPITENPPANWYNYAEQKWANVVVKNTDVNKTAYFVWIPRYEYKIYTQETSEPYPDIHFIPVTQVTPTRADTKIPEAFSWEDAEGNTVPIAGFWASKYYLSN